MNTSSINSWFRWNLVSASVLVEIISFSMRRRQQGPQEAPYDGCTYLLVLICMHARSWLEGARFSVTVRITHEADKTHSVHATSRSLFPLLSIPPFESFHLPVLLCQHRLCRRWTWIPHSNLRGYTLGTGWLKRRVTWVRGVLLIRDPLHRTRPCTLIWWKLLGTGSTWPPRHPTSHPTSHTTGHTAWDPTWDVTLHAGGNPSRYTARNIPDRGATRRTLHNLLSGFLSGNVYGGKVGGLERV